MHLIHAFHLNEFHYFCNDLETSQPTNQSVDQPTNQSYIGLKTTISQFKKKTKKVKIPLTS